MERKCTYPSIVTFPGYLLIHLPYLSRFLLVKSHMDTLEAQVSVAGFLDALENLPEGCPKTFEAALNRIEDLSGPKQELAIHVLTWVLGALRPLTTNEVRHAFVVDYNVESAPLNDEKLPSNEEDLTSLCAGLVVVDRDTRTLRLVHETARKALLGSSLIREAAVEPHERIARTCLILLLKYASGEFMPYGQFIESHPKYSLLGYAADYWFNHSQRAQRPDLDNLILKLLSNKYLVSFSFQCGNAISQSSTMNGLHASVYFKKPTWAERLLRERPAIVTVDERTGEEQTALHWWAAVGGCESMFKLLLDYGADMHAQDPAGNTPLHLAVIWGNTSAVQLLLSAGANPSTRNNKQCTALQTAVKCRHIKAVELLLELEQNVDINALCKHEHTPLIEAAIRGENWKFIASLLLHSGADVNRQDGDGRSALHHAAKRGLKNMAWLIAENDANLDLQDNNGVSAIHIAAHEDDYSLFWYLAEKGANLELVDNQKRTVLHVAAQRAQLNTVEYLLRRGVNPSRQDTLGNTALHYAVREGGNAEIVRELLRNGADPAVGDRVHLYTPLHCAVDERNVEAVKILLEDPAGRKTVNMQDQRKHTPLHLACITQARQSTSTEEGKPNDDHDLKITTDIISALIEAGAALDAKNHVGETPLMYAAKHTNVVAVELLVDKGADIGIRTDPRSGRTALDYAIAAETLNREWDRQEVIQILSSSRRRGRGHVNGVNGRRAR